MKGFTIQNSIDLLEKAVKGGGSGGSTTAEKVSYDNTDSGLTAETVQAAIDEIDGTLDTATGSISTLSGKVTDLENPVLYSSTEKQIGVLSDDTPVYEKTVILTDTDVPVSGTPKAISVEEGIKIYDIQGSLTFTDEVTPLDFYLLSTFFSNCREVISDHALYISATFTGKTCTEARVTYTYTKPVITNTRKKK